MKNTESVGIMTLAKVERQARRAGGTAVLITLSFIFLGIWRGMRRPVRHVADQVTSNVKPRELAKTIHVFCKGMTGVLYCIFNTEKIHMHL